VLPGEPHGAPHYFGIAAVKAAGDVRRADASHDLGVVAHAPRAEGLPHVAVEVNSSHEPILRSSHAAFCIIGVSFGQSDRPNLQ
jgi:hypothetical protein